MSVHATREAEVDNWLRRNVLIDLYQVVREGIMVSEPRYSIKNIEHFYLDARAGDVTNAGASIVWYEKWKETGEQKLLDDIERYNEDDVRSTQELRDWLLTLRPTALPWASQPSGAGGGGGGGAPQMLSEAEARLVPYRQALVELLPADRLAWTLDDTARELTFQLLDFHRRVDKPAYWAMFARMDMTEDELLEDPECLAGLRQDPKTPPEKVKRSVVYTYTYPLQETKLRNGSAITRADTGDALGDLDMDPEAQKVRIKVGPSKETPPPRLNLGPGKPISTTVIQQALFRFADTVINDSHRYAALESVLTRDVPVIKGKSPDAPMIAGGKATVEACAAVVMAMQNSYLFIQGPPGAGKTYTGSHVIVELLKAGKRVGITSNSHRPINHLLGKVVEVANKRGVHFLGVKKSTKGDESEYDGDGIQNVYQNEDVFSCGAQLIAGTAWLFSREDADQYLDYLFVDEAGQVSLANLIAVGTSAHNLVLLGDQMQLAQPTQGVHPGRSGDSSLDYLLDGVATIAANRGIFLETTWRMHPDVCNFISEAVYDSRLEPEAKTRGGCLCFEPTHIRLLKPAGIVFAPIEHAGCSQQSAEEAQLVKDVYDDLLLQSFTTDDGKVHPMTAQNILVVAPYNMQVNLLRETLPAGARVGTVDKFQGQEAEVVLISMTTSSEAELPRFMEFLFSKNRLNVAVSRAKSLAVLVANPALTTIKCSTPEQMGLVNTLCWVASVGTATGTAT